MPEGLAAANAAGPLLSASMSVPASTTASLFLNNTSVVSPSPPSRTRTRLRSHAFCSQPLYVQLAWAVLRCHKPHGPGPMDQERFGLVGPSLRTTSWNPVEAKFAESPFYR